MPWELNALLFSFRDENAKIARGMLTAVEALSRFGNQELSLLESYTTVAAHSEHHGEDWLIE